MAKAALISLSLCLLLFHGCLAQQCEVQQLTVRPPTHRYQSEAGFTEYWYAITDEFKCAGIEFVRYNVEAKGLVLPYYSNTPHLIFILEGSGILGTVMPGCDYTYESESGSMRHQKVRRFHRGDFLALPEGITVFLYNDGDDPLIFVSLLDIGNEDNQLGLKYRKFFLAGNPQSIRASSISPRTRIPGIGGRSASQDPRNIFFGFDEQLLAQAFKADAAVMRKVRGIDDRRGTIVRANNLTMMLPEWGNEEEGDYNNIHDTETFCSYKLMKNLDRHSSADIYIPRGGRISNLNTDFLPILEHLHLSAQRGMLFRNAMVAPQVSTNAHSAIYATNGSARIQVVGPPGRLVFNGVLNAGQLLVVPQDSVVVKRAGHWGFEWIAFNAIRNATNPQFVGRLSAIPNEVLITPFASPEEMPRA